MCDEALHAAERFGKREALQLRDECAHCIVTAGELHADHRPARERSFQARAHRGTGIGQTHLHAAGSAGKYRRRARRGDLGAEQIAVALLHDHEREACEDESQKQGETVGVIQSGEQHEEQQCCEGEPGTRRRAHASRCALARGRVGAVAGRQRAGRSRYTGTGTERMISSAS